MKSPPSRGQVGIGTLIVFIAMVLVATIASGVLVNTAGQLQATSESVGESSTSQVVDRVEVYNIVGRMNTGIAVASDNVVVDSSYDVEPGDSVDNPPLLGNVTTADGRNVIVAPDGNVETEDGENIVRSDGTNINVQNGHVVTDDGNIGYAVDSNSNGDVFTYGDGGGTKYNVETAGGVNVIADLSAFDAASSGMTERIILTVGMGPGANSINLSEMTIRYIGPSETEMLLASETTTNPANFSITEIRSEDDSGKVLTRPGDRFTIQIEFGAEGQLQPLGEGEEATLILVPASGSKTTIKITIPHSTEAGSTVVL